MVWGHCNRKIINSISATLELITFLQQHDMNGVFYFLTYCTDFVKDSAKKKFNMTRLFSHFRLTCRWQWVCVFWWVQHPPQQQLESALPHMNDSWMYSSMYSWESFWMYCNPDQDKIVNEGWDKCETEEQYLNLRASGVHHNTSYRCNSMKRRNRITYNGETLWG